MPQDRTEKQEPDMAIILGEARKYAQELREHVQNKAEAGTLSPAEMALFSRMVFFLEFGLAEDLTGDPEALG